MTENARPTRSPIRRAATNAQASATAVECQECGWRVVTDIALYWMWGRAMTLCDNPWACWERQINEREALGTRVGDAG